MYFSYSLVFIAWLCFPISFMVLLGYLKLKKINVSFLSFLSFFLAISILIFLAWDLSDNTIGYGMTLRAGFVPGILAIIFGIFSFIQIKLNKLKGKELSIIGIIVGIFPVIILLQQIQE